MTFEPVWICLKLQRKTSFTMNFLLNGSEAFHRRRVAPGGSGANTQDGHIPHMMTHLSVVLQFKSNALLPNLTDSMFMLKCVLLSVGFSCFEQHQQTCKWNWAGCRATRSTPQQETGALDAILHPSVWGYLLSLFTYYLLYLFTCYLLYLLSFSFFWSGKMLGNTDKCFTEYSKAQVGVLNF